MNQLEWSILHCREAGGIEVQLRHFTLLEPAHVYVSDGRPTLGLILPPYPDHSAVRYNELGSAYHNLGNIHLTPPFAQCHYLGAAASTRSVSCLFDASLFQSITHIAGACSPAQILSTIDIRGKSGGMLDQVLRLMAQELTVPGFATNTMIEGLGLAALAELAQHLNGRTSNESRVRGRLSESALRTIQDYVNERSGHAPTITELAQQCGMGPRRFMTLFRAATGQTVRSWVDDQRINKARRLLTDTRTPLKVIAFELGFANPGVFSTAFKRAAGVTPSEYRNRARAAGA